MVFDRAILAVELYNVAFDFGPVTYKNLEITATTAASGWCTHYGHSGYSNVRFRLSLIYTFALVLTGSLDSNSPSRDGEWEHVQC